MSTTEQPHRKKATAYRRVDRVEVFLWGRRPNGDACLFTDLPAETCQRLPALLSDALQGDVGNALINRCMAEHGIAAAQVGPLDRLACMSHRNMGALTFRPSRGPARTKPTSIEHDDHAKNFSFRLRQGAAWEIAPACDISFAHNPGGEWTHQHLLSVNGKFKGFTVDDLLAVADRFAIGSAPEVIAQVRDAVKAWPALLAAAGVSPQQSGHIGQQHLLLQ